MARERRTSDTSPLVGSVKGITLTEKYPRRKIVIIAVVLVIAVIAFGFALVNFLHGDPGWNEISADSALGMTCESEVKLQYNLTGVSTASRKKLSLIYSQATENAYAIFNAHEHFDSVEGNLFDISKNPGKEIRIEPALYKALELNEKNESRYIYLAPIYQMYNDLFYSESDVAAKNYDPQSDEAVKEYFSDVLSFVSKPEHIKLELLSDNKVKLNISKEYLTFAKENDITEFLDFYWMKNAFVIDYISDILINEELTNGYLYSVDGFNRNLSASGESFSFNLFYLDENKNAANAAIMEYDFPLSIVSLRSYPINPENMDDRYYKWENGRITNPYISLNDGMSKASVPELVAASKELGCSQIALKIAPYYICDSLSNEDIVFLSNQGINTILWDYKDNRFMQSGPDAFSIGY